MVMRPTSLPSSTTSSFSMRCLCKSCLARSLETPGVTVTSSLVISTETGLVEVLLEADVARGEDSDRGVPLDDRHAGDVVLAHDAEPPRASDCAGRAVTGASTMPLSARFTRSTSRACSSGGRFLWRMPIPPSRAMVMAVLASVTESIAAERNGMFSSISRVSCVLVVDVLGEDLAVPGGEENIVEGECFAELRSQHWARSSTPNRARRARELPHATSVGGRRPEGRSALPCAHAGALVSLAELVRRRGRGGPDERRDQPGSRARR